MKPGVLFRLFRTPHLWTGIRVLGDMRSFLRLHFLYAAIESGLLEELKTPRSKAELVRKLEVERPELLEALLRMGVALGELSVKGGVYRIRGGYARAVAAEDGDPLAAVIQEYVSYHGSVYRHLAGRLRGEPLGDYLEGTGNTVARSSRVLEPFVADFAREMAGKNGPVRILEVGCGSGAYLRHAAEANPLATGLGVDMHEEVVEQAAANLAAWGIADRFRVVRADIRRGLPSVPGIGSFDLVTLYNNVYYFTPEERMALFRDLRARLEGGGALAIVTAMRDNTIAAADFDLILRCTVGCTPLPELREITSQLRRSGFAHVESSKLAPSEALYGVVARK